MIRWRQKIAFSHLRTVQGHQRFPSSSREYIQFDTVFFLSSSLQVLAMLNWILPVNLLVSSWTAWPAGRRVAVWYRPLHWTDQSTQRLKSTLFNGTKTKQSSFLLSFFFFLFLTCLGLCPNNAQMVMIQKNYFLYLFIVIMYNKRLLPDWRKALTAKICTFFVLSFKTCCFGVLFVCLFVFYHLCILVFLLSACSHQLCFTLENCEAVFRVKETNSHTDCH